MSIIERLLQRAGATILPWWAKWAALAALLAATFAAGMLHEAHHGVDRLADYIGKQAVASTVIVQKQGKNVVTVETVYRDRIQKIYVQGEAIEAHVSDYIPPAADRVFAVPVGLVRVLDAAWTGVPAGPAADSDREPSDVPVSELGRIEAGNAKSCRVWREQALGWREFYASQQVAINGKAGDWAAALTGAAQASAPMSSGLKR